MMRSRLLLVEPKLEDQHWLVEELKQRFKYLTITCVQTGPAAHQELMTSAYDFIVTDLDVSSDRPSAIIHELLEVVPATPVIVLTNLNIVGEYMLDIVAAGVQHVLYKEDVKKDIAKLASAIISTVHEVVRRDKLRDSFSERMHAISHKVSDVDNRIGQVEESLEGLVRSINALIQAIEKRGGLEDRVVELENSKKTVIQLGMWVIGAVGAIVSAGIASLFSWYKN